MYRFHSVTQSAAFALAMSGLMAVGLAAPASAVTGAPSAPAAAARVKPAAGEDAMAKSPATDALNLLESKGYGDFNNFHRDGRMYAATVTRDGKTMTLTIDPATGKIEKRDS